MKRYRKSEMTFMICIGMNGKKKTKNNKKT